MPHFRFVQQLNRIFILACLTLLLGQGFAHAQSPSYIGPYKYTANMIVGGGSLGTWHDSEEAAMQATKASYNPDTKCDVSIHPSAEAWVSTIYQSGPVEGTETAAQRTFWISYHTLSSTGCGETEHGTGWSAIRKRIVCASWQVFRDGACIQLTEQKTPGNGEGNLGCDCTTLGVGEPINTATGNMWHIEKDFDGTGAASTLVLQRTYNSVPLPWNNELPKIFGNRWTSRYDATLIQRNKNLLFVQWSCWKRSDNGQIECPSVEPLSPRGTPPVPIPPAVSILHGDGNEYTFNLQPNLIWSGNVNNNDRLTAIMNADNTAVLAWDHRLASNGEIERFNADGRLLSITDKNGARQLLTYSDGMNADTATGRFPADAPPCAAPQNGPVTKTSLPLCVTDNWGRQLQFQYDWAGRIIEIVDPAGGHYTYEYDGPTGGCDPSTPASAACTASNLTKLTYPDGRSRTYVYNEASQINGGMQCQGYAAPANGRGHRYNAMTGLVDEKGNRYISWTYDCLGRATSSELAGGVEKVSVAYQVYSSLTVESTITHYHGDPAAPTTTSVTASSQPVLGKHLTGSITGSCFECGAVQGRYFDANGNVTRNIDFRGSSYYSTHEFDMSRNLETSRIESADYYSNSKRKISTNWHPTLRLPIKIAESKRITTLNYDDIGRLLTRSVQSTTDASGFAGFSATVEGSPQVWTYSYNHAGQVLSVDGPRTDVNDVTSYTYDAAGNLETATTALGHVTTYSNYDGAGRVGRIAAPGGKVTTLQYTARGKLNKVEHSVDGITESMSIDYDPVGNVTKVILQDGSTVEYSYDDAHRLTSIVDGLGNRIDYTLDLNGNRTAEKVTDRTGVLVRNISRVFNKMNWVTQVTGGVQ